VTKDEALLNFFKSLRVAFKNAAMYTMDHPAFVHCVEDLKGRIEDVLAFLSPLALGFTPRSVFADGRFWEGEKTYRELGMQFHLRKVKSLEFHAGVTLDELVRFSTKVTLPLRDFVAAGGAREILKKEKIHHIAVEELDYAELLKGEGEEIKDIWPHLLQEAVDQDDAGKIIEVAESFDRVVGKLNTAELIVDDRMNRNFARFFSYLKENKTTRYRSCARNLVKTFVTDKAVNLQSKLDNLKVLVSDLGEEDLASTLWEEIITDDAFDSMSFSIFSKLFESDRHQKISASLKRMFETENPVNRRPEAEEKIRALLSGTSGRFISEIYRRTLNALLKDIRFEQKIAFDHAQLESNYRYALTNVLARETDPERTAAVAARILARWDEVAGCRDFEYGSTLQEVLLAKRAACPGDPGLEKLEDALGECVERAVLDEEASPYLDRLISGLAESRLGLEVYLGKIVGEERITPFILRAYYRFFKDRLCDLTSRLKEKKQDLPFLDRLIGAAKTIDSSLSLEILKAVYRVGNDAVREPTLKAMGALSEIDKDFLFPLLRTRSAALQGEALKLLVRGPATRKRALDRYLRFPSPYGLLNRRLRAHIRTVEERDLSEAAGHLERLGRRPSIWNRTVRREARRVLEKWYESGR
jgi:hypothetical protein